MVVIDTLTVEVEVDSKNLNTNLDKTTKSLKKFDTEAKKTGNSVKNSTKTLDWMNKELSELKKQLWQTQIWTRKFKELQKEIDKADAKIKKVTKTSWGMTSAFKKAWVAIGWFFAATKIATFAKEAVLSFAAFEKGLARINTVADVSKQKLNLLWEDIKWVAEKYWIAKDELLDTAFNISSAGVEFENVNKILELSARTAVAAWTDTTTAFNGIIAVIKKYWLDLNEAWDIAEKFFITNKLWQTTIWEIASAIQNLTSTVKTAGITTEELFATYAALTWVTGDANAVTTQLNWTINALAAPTKESSKLFKELWIEVWAAAIKEKWLLWVIKDVYDATDWNLEILRRLIPEVEATKLVVALATTQYDKFNDATVTLAENQWELDRALKEVTETTSFRLDVMTEIWNNFKTDVWNAITDLSYTLLQFWKVPASLLKILLAFTAWWLIIIGNFVWGAFGAFLDLWTNLKAIFFKFPEFLKAAMNLLPGIVQSGINEIFSKLWSKVWDRLKKALWLDKVFDKKLFKDVDTSLPWFKRVWFVVEKTSKQLQKLNKAIFEEMEQANKWLWETSEAYEDLTIASQKFGSELAKADKETEEQTKTLNSMNWELAAMKLRLQEIEAWSNEFNKLQGEITAAEKELKKYNTTSTSWSNKAADALKKAINDQVKDLDKLKTEWTKTYTDITDEILTQEEKIEKLILEYDDLTDKIENVWTKWKEDISKITDELKTLEEKLKWLTEEWDVDIAKKQKELLEERLELLKELWEVTEQAGLKTRLEDVDQELEGVLSATKRNRLDKKRIWILEKIEQKILNTSRLSADEIEAKEKLLKINEQLSQLEWKVTDKAAWEITKTETDLLLEKISASETELQKEIDAKKLERKLKNDENAAEIADLEALRIAKQVEVDAEKTGLEWLLTSKNTLEEAYLKAFGARVEIEAKKVDSLTKKYDELAAAKLNAGYSGSVLGAAETLSNQPNQNFDTRQTDKVNTSSVNIYWDTTINEKTDLDNFANELNSKINP